MKTASLPSLRVELELRDAAEDVLAEGESLSAFLEASVREAVDRRRARAAFMARGLAARDDSKHSGLYDSAAQVHGELDGMLHKARAKFAAKQRA